MFPSIAFDTVNRVGITPQQFEQLQKRVRSPKAAEPVFAPQGQNARRHEIIIGIDPSLRGTGYGVIRPGRSGAEALAHGTIKCPASMDRSRCLLRIVETLREVIRQHRPTVAAVEGLFFAQNLQTALIMGEARGAALVALAEGGMEIFEIAPRKVKQAVVGFGGAQKLAVARMVQRMLRLDQTPDPDAADALALAIAHAQASSGYSIAPLKKV